MKRKMVSVALVSVCVAGMVCLSCAPTIVGTDAGVWSTGKLYAASSKNLDAVYAAAVKTVQQLELEITEQAKDVFYAKVVAKGADGKMVRIRIEPMGETRSEFSIQVGSFGNEERSRMIFREMQKNLGVNMAK